MLVFAVETSCDETSICLLEDKKIIKHLIYSQEIHSKFGGVVPELASRNHLEQLQIMTRALLEEKKIEISDVDVFTSTCGPGLIGCLLVGSTFTKSLALSNSKPFIPVNHLEGHILSTSFNNQITYPHLVLLLTGGHTQIYLMKNSKKVMLLGETTDDAIGEAFDKTAKLIGLSYPGGKEIEKYAINGDENFFILPKPLINEKNFNFSFSGIKTYVSNLVKKNKIDKIFKNNLCASFQKNVSELLVSKLKNGLVVLEKDSVFIKSISVVGGVANNIYIKNKLEKFVMNKNIKIFHPLNEMTSDNAAMIAWACIKNYKKQKNDIFFKPQPRMKVRSVL